METILIVDDDVRLLKMLRRTLVYEGYDVLTAEDGQQALEEIYDQRPDVIVLDWMMPELNGLDVLQTLRKDQNPVPVLMLTARDAIEDRVEGLEVGADDYLVKPFAPAELVARVRAVLRRGPLRRELDTTQRVVCDGVALDPARHEVMVDNVYVEFTATEFRLLHVLLSSPAIVFTREQLINRVIGDGALVDDRNIDVHIRALRKKLGPHRDIIETVRGVGYRCVSRTGNQ